MTPSASPPPDDDAAAAASARHAACAAAGNGGGYFGGSLAGEITDPRERAGALRNSRGWVAADAERVHVAGVADGGVSYRREDAEVLAVVRRGEALAVLADALVPVEVAGGPSENCAELRRIAPKCATYPVMFCWLR